jgi:hypothetical protein
MHHWTLQGFRPHHCWLCPCEREQKIPSDFPTWDHSGCEPVTQEQLEAREFFEYIKDTPGPKEGFRIASYRGVPLLNPKGLGEIHEIHLIDTEKLEVSETWLVSPERSS